MRYSWPRQRSSGRDACLISPNWASCCDCFDFLKATATGGRKARWLAESQKNDKKRIVSIELWNQPSCLKLSPWIYCYKRLQTQCLVQFSLLSTSTPCSIQLVTMASPRMPVAKGIWWNLWPNLCLMCLDLLMFGSSCFYLRLEDESIRQGEDLLFLWAWSRSPMPRSDAICRWDLKRGFVAPKRRTETAMVRLLESSLKFIQAVFSHD